jgi:hypothetical protein
MEGAIRFSAGRDTFDNRPSQRVVKDFGGLIAHIEAHRGERKGLNYICGPMAYGPHDKPEKYTFKAHYRLASHAEPCSFLSMDIDYMGGEPVQNLVLQKIEHLSSYAYETASSTPDSPRMRIIIGLDREVDRAERITLGEVFEAGLKYVVEAQFGSGSIKFDPSVYRPEQPNYNPTKGARSWKFP